MPLCSHINFGESQTMPAGVSGLRRASAPPCGHGECGRGGVALGSWGKPSRLPTTLEVGDVRGVPQTGQLPRGSGHDAGATRTAARPPRCSPGICDRAGIAQRGTCSCRTHTGRGGPGHTGWLNHGELPRGSALSVSAFRGSPVGSAIDWSSPRQRRPETLPRLHPRSSPVRRGAPRGAPRRVSRPTAGRAAALTWGRGAMKGRSSRRDVTWRPADSAGVRARRRVPSPTCPFENLLGRSDGGHLPPGA
jgi:hypothetical protein